LPIPGKDVYSSPLNANLNNYPPPPLVKSRNTTLDPHIPHAEGAEIHSGVLIAGDKAPFVGGSLSPNVCLLVNIHYLNDVSVLIFEDSFVVFITTIKKLKH